MTRFVRRSKDRGHGGESAKLSCQPKAVQRTGFCKPRLAHRGQSLQGVYRTVASSNANAKLAQMGKSVRLLFVLSQVRFLYFDTRPMATTGKDESLRFESAPWQGYCLSRLPPAMVAPRSALQGRSLQQRACRSVCCRSYPNSDPVSVRAHVDFCRRPRMTPHRCSGRTAPQIRRRDVGAVAPDPSRRKCVADSTLSPTTDTKRR